MRISLISLFLLAAGFAVYAQEGVPRMYTIDPVSAQRGDVVTVTGDFLDAGCVTKVFLTDGSNDTQVEVTEQSKTTIKFKVPGKIAAGRLAVMILTPGPNPRFIEEPVKLLITE